GRRHRRRLRRAVGLGLGPRPPARHRERRARDAAAVRRHLASFRRGDRPLRRVRGARAARRLLDPESRRIMKRIVILAALAAALAACGEKAEPTASTSTAKEPFTVLLDYVPNADHAGIYAAQAARLYAKAGLDVKLQAPPDPSAPLKLLQAGKADVAISYEPELMLARD